MGKVPLRFSDGLAGYSLLTIFLTKSYSYKKLCLSHYFYWKIVLEPHCCDNSLGLSSSQAKVILMSFHTLLSVPFAPSSTKVFLESVKKNQI